MNSRTFSVNALPSVGVTSTAPFELTLNPSTLNPFSKIHKIEYDFGDGFIFEQKLTLDSTKITKPVTHVYHLTSSFIGTFNVNVKTYLINKALPVSYGFTLRLNAPTLESISNPNTAVPALLDELHLIGSRMFGFNNELVYIFESINPNYTLPVSVIWNDKKDITITTTNKELSFFEIVEKGVGNRPYKLLAPFENEVVTSIDTDSHIISVNFGDSASAYNNPDNIESLSAI